MFSLRSVSHKRGKRTAAGGTAAAAPDRAPAGCDNRERAASPRRSEEICGKKSVSFSLNFRFEFLSFEQLHGKIDAGQDNSPVG